MTPLRALHDVASRALWVGTRTEAVRVAEDYGLITATYQAGGYVWGPSARGMRCLRQCGGLVRTLDLARQLGPAPDPRDTLLAPPPPGCLGVVELRRVG